LRGEISLAELIGDLARRTRTRRRWRRRRWGMMAAAPKKSEKESDANAEHQDDQKQ
jgi:hypothetical protein